MPFTKKGKVAIIAFDKTSYASVVQWIERQIPVLNVGGSSPFGRAKIPVTHLGGGYFVALGARTPWGEIREPPRAGAQRGAIGKGELYRRSL